MASLLPLLRGLAAAALIALAGAPAGADDPVLFVGAIQASDDVSAIAKVGDFLVIGADEAVGPEENRNVIQVLEPIAAGPAGEARYARRRDILLYQGPEKTEMDIEAFATDGNVLYVIGSHSKKRKRPKAGRTRAENRKRFHGKIEPEASRGRIYRLELTADGAPAGTPRVQEGLAGVIAGHPLLGLFAAIPGKENGVDIEGLAAAGGWLYAGFRGPVLREGYVPVLRFRFEDPAAGASLLYVTLGGRGIRSLARVSDGFLIVAGPVGAAPPGFQLYWWDGRDMMIGRDRPPGGGARLLTALPVPGDAKAEGLVVMAETAEAYELIVAFDGTAGPPARRYRVARP